MLFLSVSAFSVSAALESYALQLLSTGKGFLELVNGLSSLTSETINQSVRHQLPSKLPNFLHDSIANRSLSSIHHRYTVNSACQNLTNNSSEPLISRLTQQQPKKWAIKSEQPINQSVNQSINQSFNQLIGFKMPSLTIIFCQSSIMDECVS